MSKRRQRQIKVLEQLDRAWKDKDRLDLNDWRSTMGQETSPRE